MRLLSVTHDYLPRHVAGTEIYAHQLGVAFAGMGHSCAVYTTEQLPGVDVDTVQERSLDGLEIRVRALGPRDPEQVLRDPGGERVFAALLRELKPEVVHIHHLQNHGFGLPQLARRSGAAVVYTLHDFHLDCAHPLGGQRFGWDREVCAEVELERCAQCLRATGAAAQPLRPGVAGAARVAQRLAPAPLSWLAGAPLVRGIGRLGQPSAPAPDDDWVRRRLDASRALLPFVQRFIAPSRFVAEQVLAQHGGLPQDRVVHLPHGYPGRATPPHRSPRDPSEPLRFAYVGTLVRHKGALDLIRAFRILQRRKRSGPRASLVLHGALTTFPDYVRELRRAARGVPGVRLGGAFPPGQASEVLAEADVLVVPSKWYENTPLTVLEARRCGVVPVVARMGGLPELVEAGHDGLDFPAGDIEALAGTLARLQDEAGLLERLREAATPPVEMAVHAAAVQRVYQDAIAEVAV